MKTYKKGIEDCLKLLNEVKVITPNLESPPNKLTQNQVFCAGQVNMLERVIMLISNLKTK